MASDLELAFQELIEATSRLKRMVPSLRFVPEGITPTEMHTLIVIFLAQREGEEVRPGMVAEQMRTTKSALSQILRSLEEKGYLVRERSAKDSRAVALRPSESGQAVLDDLHEVWLAEIRSLIECIGIDDLRHMTATVKRVAEFQARSELMEPAGECTIPGFSHPRPPFFPLSEEGE